MFYVKNSTSAGETSHFYKRNQKISLTQKPKPYFSLVDIRFGATARGPNTKPQFSRDNFSSDKSYCKNVASTCSNFYRHTEENAKVDFELPQVKEKGFSNTSPLKTEFDIRSETIEYNRKLKTSHAQRHEMIKNAKLFKEKMFVSDPFFLKEEGSNSKEEKPPKRTVLFKDTTDIFFKRDINRIKEKTEQYLASPKEKQFPLTTVSNSNWHPKNNNSTLFNHGSTPFSILGSNLKSNTKTKKEIESEAVIPPQHRQKAIAEFTDLTRDFHPNSGQEFRRAISSSNKAFEKNSNLCANYLNLHKFYGSFCDKPFVKKII